MAERRRLGDILNAKPESAFDSARQVPARINGWLEFDHVRFAYDIAGKEVLSEVSIVIPAGQMVAGLKHMKAVLAAAHLDHGPGNNRLGNLKALCQRCHLRHDRCEHCRRARITVLKRRALGDLLDGPYPI